MKTGRYEARLLQRILEEKNGVNAALRRDRSLRNGCLTGYACGVCHPLLRRCNDWIVSLRRRWGGEENEAIAVSVAPKSA